MNDQGQVSPYRRFSQALISLERIAGADAQNGPPPVEATNGLACRTAPNGEDESCSRGTARVEERQARWSEEASSWNVAGMKSRDIHNLAEHHMQHSILCLQEYPKGVEVWKRVEEGRMIFHMWHEMYRGVAVAFDQRQWTLMARKGSARGC